jgi:chromosome segregation ATPase
MPDSDQVAPGPGGPVQHAEDDISAPKMPSQRVDAVEAETAGLSASQEKLPTREDLEASQAKLEDVVSGLMSKISAALEEVKSVLKDLHSKFDIINEKFNSLEKRLNLLTLVISIFIGAFVTVAYMFSNVSSMKDQFYELKISMNDQFYALNTRMDTLDTRMDTLGRELNTRMEMLKLELIQTIDDKFIDLLVKINSIQDPQLQKFTTPGPMVEPPIDSTQSANDPAVTSP